MNIIDISLSIHPDMLLYPGNPAVVFEEIESAASKSLITKLTFGTHTGTHIDAQKHAIPGGKSLESIPLETFYGPCRVIDCTQDKGAVSRETLQSANIQKGERVLLKTQNSLRGFETFYSDFIYLSPDAAAYLSEIAILVGIDYISIKQKGSSDNRPHTALLEKNIPILEGIDLSCVEPGEYILSALPIKLKDIDGAPSRAILLSY